MGLGLAVAVLIDATIIRGVLLPASMKLLGDWNWYLPRWLEWLPRVGAERDAGPPIEPTDPQAPDEPDAPTRRRPAGTGLRRSSHVDSRRPPGLPGAAGPADPVASAYAPPRSRSAPDRTGRSCRGLKASAGTRERRRFPGWRWVAVAAAFPIAG